MKRHRLAVLAAAVAILGLAAPAHAGEAPPMSQATALDRCIQAAVDRAIEAWVCDGGTLQYASPGQATDAEPQVTTEVIAIDRAAPARGQITASEPNYDTWCEYKKPCTAEITDYISSTKGNAAFGNQNGAIGEFDIVLRTSLNGRSARWTLRLYHDAGPGLRFQDVLIRCTQIGSPYGCGTHRADNIDGIIVLGGV